jgi:hypothetical protein
VEIGFTEQSAELSAAGRSELDAVHEAYVKQRCWFALIAGQVSGAEARRGPRKLARGRAQAVAEYLIERGISEKDVRVFDRPDFLRRSDDAPPAVIHAGSYALVYCPEPRPAPAPCPAGGDTTCTSGATVRAHIPVETREARFELCMNGACSELTVDLAGLARTPGAELIARMSGSLPAALFVTHDQGFWPQGLWKGERVDGFFVEARGGIGLANLADGDLYELKVYIAGVEQPRYGVKRAAVYADWIPIRRPDLHCMEASFPARHNWPNHAETELR